MIERASSQYTVHRVNGGTFKTTEFIYLPDQCKALAWLYSATGGSGGVAAVFLQSLASQRMTMRQWLR